MEKTYTFRDGSVYKGSLGPLGLPEGFGTRRWDNGRSLEGNWKEGVLTGTAVFRYSEKAYYEGSLADTKRQGDGIMHYENGYVFSGTWDSDRRVYGTLTFPDGVTTMTGNYRDDRMNGMQTVLLSNGYKIIANWEDNKFDGGSGIIRCPDGVEFEGDITDQGGWSPKGRGVMTDARGTRYEGEWDGFSRTGIYRVRFKDGRVVNAEYNHDLLIRVISMGNDPLPPAINSDGSTGDTHVPEPEVEHLSEDVPAEDLPERRTFEVPEEGVLKVIEDPEDSSYSPEIQELFRDIIGMHEIKETLDGIFKRFKVDALRRERLGIEASKRGVNFIICGNPGTGKSTLARIIGRMLYQTGILPTDTFIETDRSGLVGAHIGQTEENVKKILENARGGTLFVDEAYELFEEDASVDFGHIALDALLKDMEDHRGEYCLIFAGYRQRMDDMIQKANQGLAGRFDYRLNIPDYSLEDLLDILVSMAAKQNYYIREDAREVILREFSRQKVDDRFDNGRCSRRILDRAIERQAGRLSENMEEIRDEDLWMLLPEDFGTLSIDEETLQDSLSKLDALIGLSSVKKEVRVMTNLMTVWNESRKRGLSTADSGYTMNLVFTGNPGTGKTTVARLIGEIYYHIGLLKRPDTFVECTRADLIGEHMGETAPKVREKVQSALGGILFIDEAYSLVSDDQDSYGREAVATLVSEIENHRENLAVILAGYTDEMEEFLSTNPGLNSRFPKRLEFPDYTSEELTEMFRYNMKKRGYILDVDGETLSGWIEMESQKPDFGNGRGVRNLCDRSIERQSARIASSADMSSLSDEELVTVTDSDILSV
ncbi:MAG: AAA family ATPase [Oscillospiraceae bacterium]|nr:AAA family ATPase [Oscillospiraceae bacterium]